MFAYTGQTPDADADGRGLEAVLWHTGSVMSTHYGCLVRRGADTKVES